jgi:uncharacterized protein (TIGR03437 family)
MKLLPVLLSLCLPFLRAAETGACAAQTGGGSVQTKTSWVVQTDQVIQNQTIQLNGTLMLQGGTLTLRNVNLQINASGSLDNKGGVTAINGGPGSRLVISGSTISSISGAPGVIRAGGAAIDHSCFIHTAVSLGGDPASTITTSEFVVSPGDTADTIGITGGAGADIENNIIRAVLGQQSLAVGGAAINLRATHDSAVVGNTILGRGDGISLFSAWNNHIAGNTWKGPGALNGLDRLTSRWWSIDLGADGGIGLHNWSNNNLVERNTLIGGQSANLIIYQSAYNTITQNILVGSGYGFSLQWASYNLIDGNEVTDVYDNAIHAFKSHDNTITNNRIWNAGGGMAFYASASNLMRSNTVTETGRGVFIHESAKNTVDGNTISGGTYGVYVVSNSSGNAVTNNNIVANDSPAWDDGTGNSWKGNFWGAAAGGAQSIAPASAADAAPSPAIVPPAAAPVTPLSPPPFNGPLNTTINIKDHQVWQDARTINAAITIESGGNLTLDGATLTYVLPQPTNSIWIEVMAGGTLDIENSKLVGAEWDHNLAIKVYKGGHFTMKNSQIQNAGSWVGTFSAAVAVEADDVDIENNTFTNVSCALSGETGPIRNTRFVNNTIIGTVKGIVPNTVTDGAVYSGNRVSRFGEWGAEFGRPGTTRTQVTDNVFSDGWGPAIVSTSSLEDYGYARNTVSGVHGPDVLVHGNANFRQLQAESLSISPARTGGSVETAVTYANTFFNPAYPNREWMVESVTLTQNGEPLATRHVKVPLGEFARVRLKAAAAGDGPFGIVLSGPQPGVAPIGVSKASMRFAAAPGSQPTQQVLAVASSDPAPWIWSAAADVPWLRMNPSTGQGASEMTVMADASGFAAGTYTGHIQVTTPGVPPEVVDVTLWVTADLPVAVAKPASLNFTAAQGAPAPQKVSLALASSNLALPISVSTRTERGGNWLAAAADGKTLPATLTVSVDPSALTGGQYTGEVTVLIAGAAIPLEIPVSITAPYGGTAVTVLAVVNGASYLPGFAAGSWLTITGANLSRTTRTWAEADFVRGTMPTSIDGVSVSIDNKPAYLAYISPTQLNVLAPFAIDPQSDAGVNVTVVAPDGTAQGQGLKRKLAPGVFTFAGSNAAAVHTDGALVCAAGSVAGANCRAAKPGETVALYVTGLGTNLSSIPADGAVVTSPGTLRDPVSVTVGGMPCAVGYAGLVSAGLYQINLTVPDLAAGSYELLIRIGGVESQSGVSMAVAP